MPHPICLLPNEGWEGVPAPAPQPELRNFPFYPPFRSLQRPVSLPAVSGRTEQELKTPSNVRAPPDGESAVCTWLSPFCQAPLPAPTRVHLDSGRTSPFWLHCGEQSRWWGHSVAYHNSNCGCRVPRSVTGSDPLESHLSLQVSVPSLV